jgi:hypothetical protein
MWIAYPPATIRRIPARPRALGASLSTTQLGTSMKSGVNAKNGIVRDRGEMESAFT